MNLSSLLSMALRSLWRNKSRSALTMLGVIIGTMAVILLVAVGNGLQAYITQELESFGSHNVFITPGNPFGGGSGGFSGESQLSALANNKLRYRDVTDLSRLREYVTAVSALSINQAKVGFGNTSETTTIAGVNAAYVTITNTDIAKGSFFTKTEDDKKDSVAVLGSEIADKLFGNVDPIDKTIQVNNRSFTVVGVAKAQGSGFGGPSFDTYVFIPIQTFFSLFDNQQVTRIAVQIRADANIDTAIGAVEGVLEKRGLKVNDDFSVLKPTDILNTINSILGVLTTALGGIAAISLLVGGIGIMNIMLVTVTERTREVGLRKALGATPRIILLQFLIEAIVLSVSGGLAGVGIAYGVTLILNRFFPAVVTFSSVALAFCVSAGIGLFFGVYPARKASQLSPIEALRYE